MDAKLFVNYTDEDFSHKWDGRTYMFKAGEERILESYKADHFAKHLADRELQKAGVENILDPVKRDEVLAKCVKSIEDVSDEDMPDED